jgi:glutathione S-transferase
MKLFYFAGACSLSPHIVLIELGLPYTLEKVDFATKKTAAGLDYLTINSKGVVPALQLDDGRVLTEGPAIVQYLADLKPDSGLAPRAGTFERYQLMEILNYITSEVHKGFSPLFNPKISADWKASATANLDRKFDWLSAFLKDKNFLMGNTFTVADAYLFTVLSWTGHLKIDLSKWPVLTAYQARIAQRPKVQQALREEGLLKYRFGVRRDEKGCVATSQLSAAPIDSLATAANCSDASRAYSGLCTSSSAWVPTAILCPWSMTTMRSALSTVASRWAMMMVVRPRMSISNASCTSRSDSASSELVASSSSNIGGSLRMARASAILCRWPPDSRVPRSPRKVS